MNTVNPTEIEKFSRIADEWWDAHGKFAPLHRINPLRIQYIRDVAVQHFKRGEADASALAQLSLLDIGCGGGLICEPMARLGATVTGIDASDKNIAVASLHAKQSGLKIDYRCTTAEAMLESFDIVLALEIIEHVADRDLFVASVMNRVRPGGMAVFSTMNRTLKSYALAIIGAEYILRWLPRGTHDWSAFVKPSELAMLIERSGGAVKDLSGMVMNPLTLEWSLTPKDLSVNYLLTATS